MKKVIPVSKIMFIILFNFIAADVGQYYCSDTQSDVNIHSKTYGEIITRKKGATYYSNNQECVWMIYAKAGHRIQLEVESSDLQWSSPHSLCNDNDHMDIRDVNGSLAFWCGNDYPQEIISKSSWLKITFKTDESNPKGKYYHGIRMKFRTFESLSCPRGWLPYNDSCYTTTLNKQKWDISQRDCNYKLSNLLIIESEPEWNFLKTNLFNYSTNDFLWVGMSDIPDHGIMKWIDNASAAGFKGFELPLKKQYNHCGSLHTGMHKMFMQGCNDEFLLAVCEVNMTKLNMLYQVPFYKKDKGHDDNSIGPILIYAVVVPLVLIIATIFIVLILIRNGAICRKNHFEVPDSKEDIEQEEQEAL